MGLLRRVVVRLIDTTASIVRKNELFEQPGERRPQSPLSSAQTGARPVETPTPSPSPTDSAPQTTSSAPECTLADIPRVKAALGVASRPRLVNHWATWCDPCVEELPLLVDLHERFGNRIDFVGISWDLFQPGSLGSRPEEGLEERAESLGIRWPSLLLNADIAPEDFFAALELSYQKIPQTWLVDRDGNILHRIDGIIDAEGAQDLARRMDAIK